jgi:hypothetical protein
MVFGPGGYADEGCIIHHSCLNCPLVVCVEDLGAEGTTRIGQAIRLTEQAGRAVSPRLKALREKSLQNEWGRSDRQINTILTLFKQGRSQVAIGQEVGLSISRVGQLLRERGHGVGKGKRNKPEGIQ